MGRWTIAVLTAVTLVGALLRLDPITIKYGWLPQPAWMVRVEQSLLPVSRALLPDGASWSRVDTPYANGDPINYLKFAREMRHFYQAHVREPVFLALTRFMLWVTGGNDIAVSFASWLASTLAIVATYLLGAAVWSRPAGLLAAAALAIELEAVTWASDGWRDDTFMLFVALSAWALVRLFQAPTLERGAVAGAVCAAACLTRISALSFVVPALLWMALWKRTARRPAALAGAVTAVLIAPFLINCWRATGDPFFAINYHTRYYRAAEGLPPDESVGAFAYLAKKLQDKPVGAVDTAAVGLVVLPFTNKWSGFVPWSPVLASALRWLAVAGLVLAFWYRDGRLIWVILITSLVPYAMTWPLGSGGEWRFTQHVYPIYLVAAASAALGTAHAARTMLSRQVQWREIVTRRRLAGAAVCAAAIAGGWALYVTLPYFVIREALAAGETVSITAGQRDDLFFSSNWSEPTGSHNVTVRVAVADRVSLRLPLPNPIDYTLTLRMDGPQLTDPAYQPKVAVFLENRLVGQLRFTNDPERVGSYRFTIPRELTGRSLRRLDLVASHTVPAGQAGARFAWLPPETPVAFYLWYVRVEPRPPDVK